MRFARWLTLALFAAVSLLGQGLHLLTCHSQSHSQSGCAHAVAAGAAGHACGHTCHHQLATRAPAANNEPAIRPAGHDHDCLICRFFAQGKLAPRQTPPLPTPLAVPHRPAIAVDLPFVAVLEPYQARGPPAIL